MRPGLRTIRENCGKDLFLRTAAGYCTDKIVCAVLLFAVCGADLGATTFYASNVGSDQNGGRSDSTPFATLSYARTKLAARDTLLLRRGDLFRDSLNLSSVVDPVIGAYGRPQLAKPVISGSMVLSPWTLAIGSNTVWVATCSRKIEKLFANNTMMTLARYPDTGWLRIDTMTENSDGSGTVIRDAALVSHPRNGANYWTNAQIRWRRWSWWYETRRIAGYAAIGALTLDGKSIIPLTNSCRGWGFYIDNKREELDSPGEWFCDSVGQKVYFFPPGGSDPNSMLVEGAFRRNGIVLSGGTVNDVCIRHQTFRGLSASRTIAVSSCRFEGIGSDSGGAALGASWDIANSRISGNVFKDNLNVGISWFENSGRKGQTFIEYDTLINTGSTPGYGGSGTWHGMGILVHLSSNVQVRNNYIDRTGYAGILLGSDSNFVYNNIIKNAMWTLNDGAGIYTDCSKSFIHNNIIYDTKGDLSACGPWYPLGHGIWLEFLEDYRESVVENNTIVRSGCNGIYLPNNFACRVANNVLFDNSVAQLCLDGQETNDRVVPPRTQNLPQDNGINGNILYATSKNQETLEFSPRFDYGSLQGNWYCNPYTDSVISGYGTGNNKWRIYHYTISQWKPMFPWCDQTAKTDPFKRPAGMSESRPYGRGVIFINESPSARVFTVGPGVYKNLDGTSVTGSVTVEPFYSKILVHADSLVGVKKGEDKAGPPAVRQRGNALHYQLARKSTVVFSVFNEAGRMLVSRTMREQEAGAHRLRLNGSDFAITAPGVYQYRLKVIDGNHADTRMGKIVFLR